MMLELLQKLGLRVIREHTDNNFIVYKAKPANCAIY